MRSSARGNSRSLSGSDDDDGDSVGGRIISGVVAGLFAGSDDDDGDYGRGDTTMASESDSPSEFGMRVVMDAAYQVPFSGDIRGITRFTLPLAFESERHHVAMYLGGGIVDLRSGSLPDLATRDPWVLDVGWIYRYYLNGPHVFFSPYLAADFGLRSLQWTYRNPIIIDGDRVRTDAVGGFNGYGGIGIAVHRNWRWTAFGEVGVGGMGFVGDTREGLENDVFHSFGYFSAKVGVSFNF